MIVRWWRERFFWGASPAKARVGELRATLSLRYWALATQAPNTATHPPHPLRANAQSEHINRKQGGRSPPAGRPTRCVDLHRDGRMPPVCRPESLIVVNAYSERIHFGMSRLLTHLTHPLRANAQSEHINRKQGGRSPPAGRPTRCVNLHRDGRMPQVCRPESLIVVNAYSERIHFGMSRLLTHPTHPLRANAQSEHINRKQGGRSPPAGRPTRCVNLHRDGRMPPVCQPESLIVVNAYRCLRSPIAQGIWRAPQAFCTVGAEWSDSATRNSPTPPLMPTAWGTGMRPKKPADRYY